MEAMAARTSLHSSSKKKGHFVCAHFIPCMWACIHHIILDLNLSWIWIIYQSAYKACYHKLQSLRINNFVLVLCGTVKLQPCWHVARYGKLFCCTGDGYAFEVSALNYHTDMFWLTALRWARFNDNVYFGLWCRFAAGQRQHFFFLLHILAPAQIAFTEQHNAVFN